MVEVVQSKKRGFLAGLSRRLLAGDDAASMQREIDFMRGYLAGCHDIVTIPDRLVSNLERHARQAWVEASLREIEAQEEETPYV